MAPLRRRSLLPNLDTELEGKHIQRLRICEPQSRRRRPIVRHCSIPPIRFQIYDLRGIDGYSKLCSRWLRRLIARPYQDLSAPEVKARTRSSGSLNSHSGHQPTCLKHQSWHRASPGSPASYAGLEQERRLTPVYEPALLNASRLWLMLATARRYDRCAPCRAGRDPHIIRTCCSPLIRRTACRMPRFAFRIVHRASFKFMYLPSSAERSL
ncbi:hypothetical protein PLICRDRAFT_43204 [Plicaturopsis crispa FD-325 SS-3]|nr:hypothetical protein PLICRDRAFT_43204 [Plicaturopsis crispa FD-325 SS-3]